jgi:hypothetical protein
MGEIQCQQDHFASGRQSFQKYFVHRIARIDDVKKRIEVAQTSDVQADGPEQSSFHECNE